MDETIRQYKTFGLVWLEIAVIVQYCVMQVVIPTLDPSGNATDASIKFLVFVLLNSTLYLMIAKFPLHWFEYHGWKLFNRRAILDGLWAYSVTYYSPDTSHLTQESAKELIYLIGTLTNNHGHVQIIQTAFSITVQEGFGQISAGKQAHATTWQADAVSLSALGTVSIYLSAELGGARFSAVDNLTITRREANGRPTMMAGHFRMVDSDGRYVLRGEVTYSRSPDLVIQ